LDSSRALRNDHRINGFILPARGVATVQQRNSRTPPPNPSAGRHVRTSELSMCVKPSPTAASATASHSLRSTSLIDFSTCAQERVISRYPVHRAGRCSGAVVDSSHRFSTETREGGGVLRSKRHTLILAEPRSSPPSIPRLRAPTASRSPCRHERRHATPPSLLRKKMAPLHDLHACSEGCAWPGLQRGESVKAPPAATVQNATENHSTRRAGKVPITPQNLHRTQSTEDNPNERVCWRAPPPRLLARSEGRKGLGDPEVEELQVLAYEVSGNCGAVSSEGEGGPTTQLVVKRERGSCEFPEVAAMWLWSWLASLLQALGLSSKEARIVILGIHPPNPGGSIPGLAVRHGSIQLQSRARNTTRIIACVGHESQNLP